MKAQALIEILFDSQASISERDDAAMDLSEYDSLNVIEALIKVGSDQSVDDIILSSVGESLAEIWLRNKNFNAQQYLKLNDIVKFAVRENMKEQFPIDII